MKPTQNAAIIKLRLRALTLITARNHNHSYLVYTVYHVDVLLRGSLKFELRKVDVPLLLYPSDVSLKGGFKLTRRAPYLLKTRMIVPQAVRECT